MFEEFSQRTGPRTEEEVRPEWKDSGPSPWRSTNFFTKEERPPKDKRD